MATQRYQYYPQAPGQQNAARYPVAVGPNYQKWGEQQGWVYNPYTDTYHPDPNAQKQLEIEQGLRQPDPKQPGLSDILLPVAGIGVTYTAANQLGEEIPGLLGGAADKAKDIASLGTGATQAQTGLQGANYATSGVTRGGGGLLGDAAAPGAAAESAPGAFSLGGIGSAGNAILPAVGALGAYDVLSNDYGPARSGIEGAASGAAIGSYFGPAGAGIGAGIGGGIGLIKGLFGDHKTTKQYEAERTNKLLSKSDDPNWKTAVQHFRQIEHPEGDTGQGWNPASVLDQAKQDGKVLWGTSAVLDQFGPDWFNKYNEQQREQITQQLAQNDLFENKHGDWHITDSNKANQIADSVLKGQVQPQQTTNKDPNQSQIQQAAGLLGNAVQKVPQPLQRSNTLSPGIDKNGRRIQY